MGEMYEAAHQRSLRYAQAYGMISSSLEHLMRDVERLLDAPKPSKDLCASRVREAILSSREMLKEAAKVVKHEAEEAAR